MRLGDLLKDRLERTSLVSENGCKGTVSLSDDTVLGVSVKNGLNLGKDVWVELEFWLQLGRR